MIQENFKTEEKDERKLSDGSIFLERRGLIRVTHVVFYYLLCCIQNNTMESEVIWGR